MQTFFRALHWTLLRVLITAAPFSLFATYFGNPAQPKLQTEGLIKTRPSWYCLRIGYMADWLYRQKYRDEFNIEGTENPPSYAKLATSSATVTLNFKNWWDINALVGSSQIQVDREVFTKRQLSWGIGTKFLIYQSEAVYVGLDFKYFESQQKPLYFVAESQAYNILSEFKLNYTEMQAALGAAYRTEWLCPYIYGTYLYSKIDPFPLTVLVQLPFMDMAIDITSRSAIGKRRWGMAVGATVIAAAKGSITVESRFFNQNALNISGEIRF